MAKKLPLMLVSFLLISMLVLTGCSKTETNKDSQSLDKTGKQEVTATLDDEVRDISGETRSYVTVYYTDVDGKYLLPVNISIEPTDRAAKIAVSKLLAGPETEQVRPVIPEGTKLRDLYLKDSTAYVSLTKEFLQVFSADEAKKAVKAITLTLTEFPMVKMVQILVDGQVVTDFHGLNLESALTRPKSINGPTYEKTVNVYFGDKNANFLVPYSAPVQNDDAIKSAVQALLEGPPEEDLTRTIWPGTRLLDIEVSGKTVVVDLSKEVVGYGGGSTAENLLVSSLIATMTQFEDIEAVQLLIEGQKIEMLPEGTDISKPLTGQYNMLY
ncbi:MAG: GerMN domain-containing protein [Thermoanaerobacteraceae bacterium]|nr:GerMN domain-containing protein [Thermoanaerobacteraceae bacterium]